MPHDNNPAGSNESVTPNGGGHAETVAPPPGMKSPPPPKKSPPPPPPKPPPPPPKEPPPPPKTETPPEPPPDAAVKEEGSGRTPRDPDEAGIGAVVAAARDLRVPEDMRENFVMLGKALRTLHPAMALSVITALAKSLGGIRIFAVVRGFFADTVDDNVVVGTTDQDVAAIEKEGKRAEKEAEHLEGVSGEKKKERVEALATERSLKAEEKVSEGLLVKVCGQFAAAREKAAFWVFTNQPPAWLYVVVVQAEFAGGIATLHGPLKELLPVGPGEGWIIWFAAATASVAVVVAGLGVGKLLTALRLTGRVLALLLICLVVPILFLLFPAIESVRDGREATSLLTLVTALLLWVAVVITVVKETGAAYSSSWLDETTVPGMAQKQLADVRRRIAEQETLIASLTLQIGDLEKARDVQLAIARRAPVLVHERRAKGEEAAARIASAKGEAIAAVGQEKDSIGAMIAGAKAAHAVTQTLEPPTPFEVAIDEGGGASPQDEEWPTWAVLGVLSGALAALVAVTLGSVVPVIAWLGLATAGVLIHGLRRGRARGLSGDGSAGGLQGHPRRLVDRDESHTDHKEDR